jgi:hypothetical protein
MYLYPNFSIFHHKNVETQPLMMDIVEHVQMYVHQFLLLVSVHVNLVIIMVSEHFIQYLLIEYLINQVHEQILMIDE